MEVNGYTVNLVMLCCVHFHFNFILYLAFVYSLILVDFTTYLKLWPVSCCCNTVISSIKNNKVLSYLILSYLNTVCTDNKTNKQLSLRNKYLVSNEAHKSKFMFTSIWLFIGQIRLQSFHQLLVSNTQQLWVTGDLYNSSAPWVASHILIIITYLHIFNIRLNVNVNQLT